MIGSKVINFYKIFVTELRKALVLYSAIFFATITISIGSFFIFAVIKQSHVAQDVLITIFSYLVTIVLGTWFLLHTRLIVAKIKGDTYSEGLDLKRLGEEIHNFKEVLSKTLYRVEALDKSTHRDVLLKEIPAKVQEWHRLKTGILESINIPASLTFGLTMKMFYWYTSTKYHFTFARHVWSTQWRKEDTANIDSLYELLSEKPAVEPDVLRILENDEIRAEMRAKVGPLTPREELLLKLHLEGYSSKEIADKLCEDVRLISYELNGVITKVRGRLIKRKR